MKTNSYEIEKKRHLWNISMFIISFTLSNLISGVIYDTYVNYLQEVARPVATSFWSYYGYATFISAVMVLFVNKIGYKLVLFFCPLTSFFALVSIVLVRSEMLYQIMTVLSLVGLQLHYAILAPFISIHTNAENKTLWYSRTYWIGYAGWALTTYLGGALTVSRFASRMSATFSEARNLTKNIELLSGSLKMSYIMANRDVLLITSIIAGISLIPVLLIKEKKDDYRFIGTNKVRMTFNDVLLNVKRIIKNKYVLAFLLYWSLINFGMGLFTPYYTVFLNRNLHIDRSTASLLVSISYVAMVLFIIFTPKAVKKLGQIVTLAGVLLLSIPFMIIIANGDIFGSMMIPVVGISLFMRCGLANLGSPIDSSLSMDVVSKELRPAMSSIVNVSSGLISIMVGNFTGNYLFLEQSGYKIGYYLASMLYAVGGIILMIVFMKNYNWNIEKD